MQKKACNAEKIHSVTNKRSLFEEKMKYRKRNAMQKKFSLLKIRGHYLKEKWRAEEEMQYRRN